jgi:hypothetical protein
MDEPSIQEPSISFPRPLYTRSVHLRPVALELGDVGRRALGGRSGALNPAGSGYARRPSRGRRTCRPDGPRCTQWLGRTSSIGMELRQRVVLAHAVEVQAGAAQRPCIHPSRTGTVHVRRREAGVSCAEAHGIAYRPRDGGTSYPRIWQLMNHTNLDGVRATVGIYLGRLIAIAISIAYSNSNSNRIAAGHFTCYSNSYFIAIAFRKEWGSHKWALERIRFLLQIIPNEVWGSRADLVNRVGQTSIRKVHSTFVLAVSNGIRLVTSASLYI